MEAILIIIAVHANDPNDIPGTIKLSFPSIVQCEKARETLEYNLKFKQFIVESKCERKS